MNINEFLLQIVLVVSSVSFIKQLIYAFISPLQSLKSIKLRRLGDNMTKEEVENRLRISAIVPAWNEEVGIIDSIRSLLENDYNNLEIIVVDDGSTDGTATKVQLFEHNYLKKMNLEGKSFKFISKPNGGKGSALNTGIRASTGDVIITMDADTRFNPNAIYVMAKYFMDSDLDAAVGNVKIANADNLVSLLQQMEYTVGFYGKRTHSFMNSVYIIGGAFGAFRRDLFDKYGYFDEVNKTEDIAMSTNLQKNGCKIIFAEDAIAYTEGASTFEGLCKQRLRWKKGRFDVFIQNVGLFFSLEKKHPKFLTYFLLPLSLFFEFTLILEPILFFGVLFDIVYSQNWLLFFSWLVYITILISMAFFFGSKENNFKTLWLIPLFPFLSMLLTIAELRALLGSMKLYLQNQDVVWQSWNRKGVGNV